MGLNATFIGQMLTFAIFVGITMKWIWPFFTKILDERARKIADGLAAADKGHRDLELAERRTRELLERSKQQAAVILEEATRQAHQLVEEAKQQARVESDRILIQAQRSVEQQVQSARDQLRREVVNLAMSAAERILEQSVDDNIATKAVDKCIAGL